MPSLAQHAYLVGEGTAWTAFVPVIGGYLKTHWCVLVTTCPFCRARPGEPCSGAKKRTLTAYTHHHRRKLAQRMKDEPEVRARLLQAMPAVAFAIDTLDQKFGEEEEDADDHVPVVGGRSRRLRSGP